MRVTIRGRRRSADRALLGVHAIASRKPQASTVCSSGRSLLDIGAAERGDDLMLCVGAATDT